MLFRSQKSTADIYFATMGNNASIAATKLCSLLRLEGFEALSDINGRGLKAQMKYADKIGAKYTAVLGDNELENKKVTIKNMQNGNTQELSLDNFVAEFYDVLMGEAFLDVENAVL